MKKPLKSLGMNVKKIPNSFGTHVNLEDFYDYNDLCINHLKHVYDTLTYVISQLTLSLENHEMPELEQEMSEELDLNIERLDTVIGLMNHFNSNVISEQVTLERKTLQAQLDKNKEEHDRLVKELKSLS
jgi:hypothetical protein